MQNNFRRTFSEYDQNIAKQDTEISGELGVYLSNTKYVEVPNRSGFVYVRLRNSLSEVIQAFNDQVSATYGLPVIVVRDGTRYRVKGRDAQRYNDWGSQSSFVPIHANQHSFNPDGGGGGDLVWVYGKQMMPMAAIPSGTAGADGVVVNSYQYKKTNGTILNIGLTGTQSMVAWKPTDNQAVMGVVYVDPDVGNPVFTFNTGTWFSASITGTEEVVPYYPSITNQSHLLIAGIRLVSGTTTIGWDNIYDLRQWMTPPGTGTGGDFQPLSAELTAIANLTSSANKIPYFTGSETAGLLDFKDEDDMSSDSATAVASQQSIKAYVDNSISAVSNTNDIFRCDNCGTTGFQGTIATLPGGAVLTYGVTSGNEATMVPKSTSQLAKLRLYNTTRGDYALISNCVAGTNTITLTDTVPGTWQVGDVITPDSQTCVHGGGLFFYDFEITSGDFLGKEVVYVYSFYRESTTVTTQERVIYHPFETYAASKEQVSTGQVAAFSTEFATILKLTSNVFSVCWIASGAATVILGLRQIGYFK